MALQLRKLSYALGAARLDLAVRKVGPSRCDVFDAGVVVQNAVHAHRPHAVCVIPTLTMAGVTVACQENGLLPLELSSLGFLDRVG